MRERRFHPVLALAVMCLVMPIETFAQRSRSLSSTRSRGVADGGAKVAIRDIDGTGARSLLDTPKVRTDMPGATRPARQWARISVTYDTTPDWIDELTFRYYAISARRDNGKVVYTSYQNTVTHVDVERGRGHVGTMFVRPQALTRYGELVAIAVEILIGGEVVARESVQPRDFSPEWWNKLSGSAVQPKSGYMLNRLQSPFAIVNPDDYEYIKP